MVGPNTVKGVGGALGLSPKHPPGKFKPLTNMVSYQGITQTNMYQNSLVTFSRKPKLSFSLGGFPGNCQCIPSSNGSSTPPTSNNFTFNNHGLLPRNYSDYLNQVCCYFFQKTTSVSCPLRGIPK